MTTVDRRGCAITGATPAALDSYERALAAWQAWRRDDDTALQGARREAPGFVMAHAFAAWQLATTRDVRRVAAARPIVAGALRLPANERERCIWLPSRRCSTTTSKARRRGSAACSTAGRATRSRSASRTRSTT
jgi:hypothetical protein